MLSNFMAIFARRRVRQSQLVVWYQTQLRRNPFIFFGLPFISVIVIGSFALSQFTTIRYERHDAKVKQMSEEEALGLDKDRRRPDIREEYYVRSLCTIETDYKRLLEKDLDNWEQKRVKRLKGT